MEQTYRCRGSNRLWPWPHSYMESLLDMLKEVKCPHAKEHLGLKLGQAGRLLPWSH